MMDYEEQGRGWGLTRESKAEYAASARGKSGTPNHILKISLYGNTGPCPPILPPPLFPFLSLSQAA